MVKTIVYSRAEINAMTEEELLSKGFKDEVAARKKIQQQKSKPLNWFMSYRYIISVDIGKHNDYTAIFVIEREGRDYHVIKIDRWRRQDHTYLISKLLELQRHPKMKSGEIAFVIDATGVGDAMLDFIREAGIPAIGINIHGGFDTTMSSGRISASKNDLVFCLQNIFEHHRIKVADTIKLWAEVQKELMTFSPKVNQNTGHVSYEAIRSRDHDDLVMSLAMAALFCERVDPAVVQDSEGGTNVYSGSGGMTDIIGLSTLSIDDINDMMTNDGSGDYTPGMESLEVSRKRVRGEVW